MSNAEIAALRKIAADSRVTVQSRLHAIDRLAGIANVYLVEETMHDGRTRWQTVDLLTAYRTPGVRAKRVVISLLRRLPESARRNDRLLFLRDEDLYAHGRVNRRERLFRLKSPEEAQTQTERPRYGDPEVELALMRYEEEKRQRESQAIIRSQ